MNFKKMTPDEITDRIKRIGGVGWVSHDDYKRFSRQAMLILEELMWTAFGHYKEFRPHTRGALEKISGAKRVASRIDELRDAWEIETTKLPNGTAAYRLIGRRWEARKKKAHCSTCYCFPKPVPQEQGRMEL